MRRLNLPLVFVLILFFALSLTAQTPQYYNFNTGTSSNSFPFNMAAGKGVNSLFLAGEFNQPTPIPPGNAITKVYFRTSTAGTRTYTDLHILMAQDVITTLTTGSFYPGPYDTVYYAASATLTSSVGGWMEVTLDHSFPYDPTKSLILFVGQCGATGSGGSVYNTAGMSGIRRVWSVGGCPFAPYAGGDASLVNFGVDVVPVGPPPLCNIYSSQWCPANTLPSLPSAAYFTAASWVGDTLYVHTPTTTGTGSTTIIRYVMGGTWTPGVPLPTALTGGSMTTCNGKLYFTGGGTSSVTAGTTTCLEYNPSTGAWTSKAPMPAALSAHGSVCWGDSVIFVVGGPYTGSGTNLAVHYYRVATDTWGTIANSLPSGQGRRSHALAISGNVIYMAGGYNTAFLNTFYTGTIGSDATSITWAAKTPLPMAGLSRTGGTAYNNFFYVMGGEISGGGYSAVAYVWNIQSNAWSTIAGKPVGISNAWAGVTSKCVNDTVRVFVAGGYNGAAVNAFDYFGCGPTLVGIGNQTTIPADYSLSQNYPNPFNPTTKINYTIPKSGFVTLKIFDLLGREVAVLVNAEKSAGSYIVDYNASALTSGVYFYRLEVNGFVDTKKMTILK